MLPNMTIEDVQIVRDILTDVITEHIEHNTHRGCKDPSASDFNPKANLNDEAACMFNKKYAFGGIYQESSCDSHKVKNELKQDFSCPDGFVAHPIIDQYKISHDWTNTWSDRRCHSCWVVGKCCKGGTHSQNHHEECTITPYMCVAPYNQTVQHGAAFGGMYSDTTINPVTGVKGCPKDFEVMIFPTSWDSKNYYAICYAPFDNPASLDGVPFGGIFSSDIPNPMTKGGQQYYCPQGYERRIIPIRGGKYIYFCTGIQEDDVWLEYIYPGYDSPEPSFVDGYKIANETYLMTDIDDYRKYSEQLMETINIARMDGHYDNLDTTKKAEKRVITQTKEAEKNAKSSTNPTWPIIVSLMGLVIIILIAGIIVMYKKKYSVTEYQEL